VIALAAILIALTLIAYFAIFVATPSALRTVFCYRLGALRDALVDDTRHGRYENTEQPLRLAHEIELAMAHVDDLSMFNLLSLRIAAHKVAPPPYQGVELDGLSDADRHLLLHHLNDYHRRIAQHALLETPSGWLFSVLVLVVNAGVFVGVLLAAIPRTIYNHRRHIASKLRLPSLWREVTQFVRDVYHQQKVEVRNSVRVEPGLNQLRASWYNEAGWYRGPAASAR
jgi:hypothetical protein